MPSTKKQEAKGRKSREMDTFPDYGNMDVMLGEGKSNSLERELDNVPIQPEGQQDSGSVTKKVLLIRTKSGLLTLEMT